MENRMHRENVKSLNAIVGCKFNCVYCKPSFQRLLKRQKCPQCKTYEPHFHPERLIKSPPKTVGNQFVFFPSTADPFWAQTEWIQNCIVYAETFSSTTFLMQSKSPICFTRFKFPDNVLLGTTLETNRRVFQTPSKYKLYSDISQAPIPAYRMNQMLQVKHKRKTVTVEPVLQFDRELFADWINRVKPEAVYIGYDNHRCFLPEALRSETLKLIDELKKFTDVRIKTIRLAWYE